eukprot:12166391-Alexandrium_andersonii.AAC.1
MRPHWDVLECPRGARRTVPPARVAACDSLRLPRAGRATTSRGGTVGPVSYTHLTLPTICSV